MSKEEVARMSDSAAGETEGPGRAAEVAAAEVAAAEDATADGPPAEDRAAARSSAPPVQDLAAGLLAQQIAFVVEIDRLKGIIRRTYLTDESRRENSAEHSWHLAAMALVLHPYANELVDLLRVVKMVVVHDIVEIEAGDTFLYDEVGRADKDEREQRAAEHLFGLLPAPQRDELKGLWQEFEARRTPDARFAASLDRLQPLIHNYVTEGSSWREHGVLRSQVEEQSLGRIADGSAELGAFARRLVDEAARQGYVAEG